LKLSSRDNMIRLDHQRPARNGLCRQDHFGGQQEINKDEHPQLPAETAGDLSGKTARHHCYRNTTSTAAKRAKCAMARMSLVAQPSRLRVRVAFRHRGRTQITPISSKEILTPL